MDWDRFFNYSRAVFWIGLILVVYIFVILVDENSKNYKLRQQTQALEVQNQQLQASINDLQNKITYYGSDEYRELVARQDLNLQAPGESVVIVPHKSTAAARSNSAVAATGATKPQSNWQAWMQFLFGSQ